MKETLRALSLLILLSVLPFLVKSQSYLHTVNCKDTLTWNITDTSIYLTRYESDIRESTEVLETMPSSYRYIIDEGGGWEVLVLTIPEQESVRIYYRENVPVFIVRNSLIYRILP